jgi:hypothetical protein
MNKVLKYVPVFRGRQQEFAALKSFDFQDKIYPCLEIIKEAERKMPRSRRNSKKPFTPKPPKPFEEVYSPIINAIKAERVFVDIPVHLREKTSMKPETLQFLREVAAVRKVRTEYIKKLADLSDRIIPVISTYYDRTNKRNSIVLQEKDLRPSFPVVALRTFPASFGRDIDQIESVIQKTDYVILDWQNMAPDLDDPDHAVIIERFRKLKCTLIVHRNPISNEIRNVDLVHDAIVGGIDNTLQMRTRELGATCFSDYSGIKKDEISKGGRISPGFLYYDAVKNLFYGYKGRLDKLEDFERVIIPSVINSAATRRMSQRSANFLNGGNLGWTIIEAISNRQTPGRSPGKFKRIGMEHYLHCIRKKIDQGDFG